MKIPIIAASLTSGDWGSFTDEVTKVTRAGAEWIHVAVSDGHFRPELSVGPKLVRAVRETANTIIDVHLMLANPESQFEAFAEAGANIITLHPSTVESLSSAAEKIHSLGCKAGAAFFPGESLSSIGDELQCLDLLLIASNNGEFSPNTEERLKEAAALIANSKLQLTLQVTGGITRETAAPAVGAGADVLVSGDYIFQHENYKDAVKALKGL